MLCNEEYMRAHEKLKWSVIQARAKNMEGTRPKSEHCVKNAVRRVAASGKKGVATTNYKNCGRKKKLTKQEEKMVIGFVRKWRRKLFCTCLHIKRELKPDVSAVTVGRTLNRHMFSFFLCSLNKQQKHIKQAWILLARSSSQEPTLTRPAAEEERVGGETLAPQACLVGAAYALGFRWGDVDEGTKEVKLKAFWTTS